jgi:hypothetical protein
LERRALIFGEGGLDHELPLARILRRMSDPTLPEGYRDLLAQWALPYCHSRTASAPILTPSQMTDQQLERAIELAEAERSGGRVLRLIPG